MSMNDNPHAGHRERVKARFLEHGIGAFARHEMIEFLLFFGIPRKDTNELAHRLLDHFGSISALMGATYEELVAIDGMTHNAAVLIRLFNGLETECQRERFSTERLLTTREKIRDFVLPLFIGAQTEQVRLVCLDNNRRVLASGLLSEGSAAAVEINTRQALQLALRCNATCAVLAHNHPGGQPMPSREDVDTTAALAKALELAGVQLIDHIIVADNAYLSMRDVPLCAALFR